MANPHCVEVLVLEILGKATSDGSSFHYTKGMSMNHKRFKKKWMVPIGLAAAVLLMILIGSTTSVQAQTGMPSTIPNPGVPIDEEMKFSLDGQDYAIDTELPNDQDPKLHKQGDQICVVWPNGSTGECIKSGQENFIVEPISNIGNGTGTIWTTQGNCRWLYQLWVHGTPIQVNLLKVDDQNGESASWCDGTVKLIEKGESDDHNGQIVEVTDDGKVLIDGIEKVTSGVSTCAVLIEAKSGAMHRIERYTPLSPGSRQGLLHPSVLLLGKDAGWEDLNRGSGVGLYKQLADQVCPPEVPPPPAGPSSLFLPLVCSFSFTGCPLQFGFGENQPDEWYAEGEGYPTQPDKSDIWVKLNEQFDSEGANTAVITGSYTPWKQGEPVESLGERYIKPDEAIKFVNDARPGTYQINLILRWYNPLRDKVICFVIVKIDDPDPGLP